jgi:hypothetical protein
MQQSFRSLIVGTMMMALAAAATAADPKDEDWIPLFNGKDLNAWQVHGKVNPKQFKLINGQGVGDRTFRYVGIDKIGPDSRHTTLWEVDKGVLVGSRAMSYLFTKKADFEDFHLRIEAKVNNNGDSGVFLRATFAGGTPKGYEAQINAGGAIQTGSLSPIGSLAKHKSKLVAKSGGHLPHEIFTQEVIAEGPRIRILINGKETVNFTDPDHTYKKGCLALQVGDSGTVATFHKIEWKPIKK